MAVNLEIYPWHERQWKQVCDAHAAGRLPHALLLAGIDGAGMEHFATSLSAYLLCRDKSGGYACGTCKSCVLYSTGNHPDIYRVEPEESGKQIKVDNNRGLIEFVQLSSQYASSKIAILNPADAMNRNAANALLKTLEEPPPEGIFILVSTRPARLPVTIRSRCQRINFTRVDHNTGVTWLMGRAGVADEQAAELFNLAQGRPLLALDLAGSDLVSRQVEVLSDLGRLIKAPEDVTGLARKWQEYGAQDVFRWLMGYMLRMARIKLHESKEAMEPSRIGRDLHHIANQLNLPQLVNSHDLAMQHYRAVTGPFNLNPVGLLEDFIIYWQAQYQLQEKRR